MRKPNKMPKSAKLFVLGDSISKQYFPYLKTYLKGGFEIAKNEEMGDSNLVIAVLERLRAAGGMDADILLLNTGLHDIKTDLVSGRKQVSPAAYCRNLKRIIRMVRRMGPELVWVRTTPVDDATHNNRKNMKFHRFSADCAAYNRAADRIMKAARVPTIDLCSFTEAVGGNLYIDHVHYLPNVRKLQAAYIAGWISGRKQ